MEIVTSWEQKGRAEGRAEGWAEGRAEGQRGLLERQLTRKLGSLPPTLLAQIGSLSSSQLTALGEALLDFTTLADLEAWLGAPPPSQDDAVVTEGD